MIWWGYGWYGNDKGRECFHIFPVHKSDGVKKLCWLFYDSFKCCWNVKSSRVEIKYNNMGANIWKLIRGQFHVGGDCWLWNKGEAIAWPGCAMRNRALRFSRCDFLSLCFFSTSLHILRLLGFAVRALNIALPSAGPLIVMIKTVATNMSSYLFHNLFQKGSIWWWMSSWDVFCFIQNMSFAFAGIFWNVTRS